MDELFKRLISNQRAIERNKAEKKRLAAEQKRLISQAITDITKFPYQQGAIAKQLKALYEGKFEKLG